MRRIFLSNEGIPYITWHICSRVRSLTC